MYKDAHNNNVVFTTATATATTTTFTSSIALPL